MSEEKCKHGMEWDDDCLDCELCNAHERIKELESQLTYYKRMIADANERKFPEIVKK